MLNEDFTESFVQNVLYSARQFIEVGLWHGIDRTKFDRWTEQYQTEEEKLLLAFILDSLVYRSNEHTTALIEQAISRNIPQALFNRTGNESYFTEFDSILDHRKPTTKYTIVPVIRNIDPPTKSGPLLARLYKRLGLVNEKNMQWPWLLNPTDKLEIIIFIDDFVGSGKQFLRFLDKHLKVGTFPDELIFIYCPLTATHKGLYNISQARPEIHLAPIETISEKDSFFNGVEHKYDLNANQMLELHNIYDNYIRKVGFKRLGGNNPDKNLVRGYGKLALTYAYQHATPNASLPLLWANSDNYYALFVR